MSVKRKNEKRNKLDELYKKSVKIKCIYCDSKDDCRFRKNKEKSEDMGITTYCTMTPNKPKSFLKKQKKLGSSGV
jgi:hypothetical protein